MKASDLTPSKYLKQSDVEPPKLVTIAGVAQESFDDRGTKKTKWAMSFRELDKPLLLNKTNINRTVKATGTDDVAGWTGKKIVLYFDPDVEFGGDIVGGIRIRAARNQAASEPVEPPPRGRDDFEDSEVPF